MQRLEIADMGNENISENINGLYRKIAPNYSIVGHCCDKQSYRQTTVKITFPNIYFVIKTDKIHA